MWTLTNTWSDISAMENWLSQFEISHRIDSNIFFILILLFDRTCIRACVLSLISMWVCICLCVFWNRWIDYSAQDWQICGLWIDGRFNESTTYFTASLTWTIARFLLYFSKNIQFICQCFFYFVLRWMQTLFKYKITRFVL